MIYTRDDKNSTRKFLGVMNKSSIWQDSINLHKSIAFLYTINKHTEKEIMDILQVIKVSKKIKLYRNKSNHENEGHLQ